MKSEMKIPVPPAAAPISYPYLGEYCGEAKTKFVVLFTGPKCGMVVGTDGQFHPIGYYGSDWDESGVFKKFEGSITLTN